MKNYLVSAAIGIAVGCIYGVLQIRSPAPPVFALIGLFGMLMGEQIPPLVRHLCDASSCSTWLRQVTFHSWALAVGVPPCRAVTPSIRHAVQGQVREAFREEPRWVGAILDAGVVWFLMRLVLVSAFVLGGFTKLLHFNDAIAEQARFGLQPAAIWAAAAIIVELGGSALVICNRLVWLGAGGLGVLTLVATLVADNFWALDGPRRFMALNGFFEHLGLIAGFVLVAILSRHLRRRSSI